MHAGHGVFPSVEPNYWASAPTLVDEYGDFLHRERDAKPGRPKIVTVSRAGFVAAAYSLSEWTYSLGLI
jgi:hypothetical protein